MKQHKIIDRLDGRKFKNDELFKKVNETLKELNIVRSVSQIQNRWKSLKANYYKAKGDTSRSGASPAKFVFFEAMADLLGGRPLSNVEGVDVGMEEDEEEVNVELSDKELSSADEELDGQENSVDNLESSIEEENSIDHSLSGTAKKRAKPKTASGYQRALQNWSAEQREFLEAMQKSHLEKVEVQQQNAREHEERMFMSFMEENTRSNERLLTHLFEGLRGMLSHPAQGATHPHHHPHPHPHPHPHLYPYPMMPHPHPPLPTATPQNAYLRAQTPDFVLHDLDVDN
ncbi:homeobox protein slou-like [Sardina pilchardus]|uniref:homeobox protein slou-like n=1 Tax=Sardina pilchardus TaxID=27697 RepID=UPI002E0F048D